MEDPFTDSWEQIKPVAGQFPPAAFSFVVAGLAHTVRTVHGDTVADEAEESASEVDEESRHVSGKQLCLGLKDFAIRRYGRLARTVLHRWNIQETDDFGKIVFAMIEAKQLRKTANDRYEDFCGVFDFDDAFADRV